MNLPVIIFFAIGAIALIVFLVRRNLKDEKQLENQLNNDYHKPKESEGEIDAEELPK